MTGERYFDFAPVGRSAQYDMNKASQLNYARYFDFTLTSSSGYAQYDTMVRAPLMMSVRSR